jgi:uncharacterized protein related to proFAR isomerase
VFVELLHPTHIPQCPYLCFIIDVFDGCVVVTYVSSEDEKYILYNEHTCIDPTPVVVIDSSPEASLMILYIFSSVNVSSSDI